MTTRAISLCIAASMLAGPALAQMPGMGPPTVGVIEAQRENVPFVVTVPGRAVAYEDVDIRPRVNGVIGEIAYEPGKPAAVGDVLFKIEDETYAAQVQAAEAEVARAEASVSGTRSTLRRYQSIAGTGVTAERLQEAEVAYAQARASLSAANASLRQARLELARTVIASPIEGIPDVATVSVGAIVTANQGTALTTVTRLDPIYVDVEESSARILGIREQIDAGNLTQDENLDIRLRLESGSEYAAKGRLVSPGSTVSTTTGTTAFRMAFDNPEHLIMPGQYLRVDVTLGTTEAILIPQMAARRSPEGALIVYVARDGKAVQLKVKEAGSYQNNWIVTAGLEAGEQVIVDNVRRVSAGVDVQTTPVTIVDGIVQDAQAAAGSTAADQPASGDAPAAKE